MSTTKKIKCMCNGHRDNTERPVLQDGDISCYLIDRKWTIWEIYFVTWHVEKSERVWIGTLYIHTNDARYGHGPSSLVKHLFTSSPKVILITLYKSLCLNTIIRGCCILQKWQWSGKRSLHGVCRNNYLPSLRSLVLSNICICQWMCVCVE